MTRQTTRQRTFALVAAGLLGTAALTACGSDDSRTTGGVAVDDVAPAASAPEASAPATSASAAPAATAVAPLQTVQGVLQRDEDQDDDADDQDDPADRYDDFTVNGVDVDFGPSEWVITAGALQDYDGDGTAEPFAAELDGLVGQQVTLQVRDDDDDDDADDAADARLDDADVYEVNGLALRGITGPAPWRGGPVPSGPLAG